MNKNAIQGPPWYQQSVDDVLDRLDVDAGSGLGRDVVSERARRYGPNRLEETVRRGPLRILLGQFADFMIFVLMVAALVSGVVGDPQDTLAIVFIVLLNAIIGAVQEYRAERAVAALRDLAAPEAQVRRDGDTRVIGAQQLVPGDIVLLEAGKVVPADLRLVEVAGLKLDEAVLTGESVAVEKHAQALPEPDLPIGDRRNMAYKGTLVSSGRGVGAVVATAMDTELGRIARLLHKDELQRTPLQRRLAHFGKRLGVAVLAVCTVIFVFGLLRGEPVVLMFLTAVTLAVAAIPEALPAVVTMSLAIGAHKMSARNALIRRLPAVETLGSVTVICADKTGTLTQNRMLVDALSVGGRRESQLPANGDTATSVWRRLGEAMALNNDVQEDSEQVLVGEPTEVALYAAAREAGYARRELEQSLPRIAELPFDATRKCMSTLHRADAGVVVFTKGAPENVLSLCVDRLGDAGSARLDIPTLQAEADALASEGYRVLAFATRRLDTLSGVEPGSVEQGLSLLGFVALIDPPRPEARKAVELCRTAGITPVMITGDHAGTALAIAVRLGIAQHGDPLLTGAGLKQISAAELERQVARVHVYARVNPEQKIRIVEALQACGEYVAMTGDGVNDAPALKRAEIGIAMGRKGTDVAREAADMVLLDDDFATIVAAVAEGRRIFDNIRKFVKYTMTSNAGEIWTLSLAPFFGLPLPLLPIHILWINLVTDGLPGLALTAEPAARGIMQRPPRPPSESIFAHGMWQHMLWVGLLIGGLSILSQAWSWYSGAAHWQTMVFTVLTLSQLAHVVAIRSERESLLTLGLGSNLPLLGAVLLTVGLQLAVIYVPFLQGIFKTAPLAPLQLLACFGFAAMVFVAVEMEKWLVRGGYLYTGRSGAKE